MNKPWSYKNWLIWPNTIISNLFETSCTDSNIGVCLKDVKIEQCIESCNKYCSVGYFIELSNGKTICLPLDNIKYKDLSPYNLLTPQKDTEFKNMNISVFVNTDEFPFPPKDGGNVYYNDKILITSEDKKLSMGSENPELNKSFIKMIEKQTILKFAPVVSLDDKIESNIAINFNQDLLLNVNQTDIILSTNGSNLIWNKILTDFTSENKIKLIPQNKDMNNKKIKIGNKFKIKSNDMFIKISDDNSLILDKVGSFFTLKQMELGYYCDKKKCKSTEINKEKIQKLNITRRSDCFNLCFNPDISKTPPKKYLNLWWLYLIIGIVILIIIIITIVKINF